jgi:hypothetical protein
MDPPAPGDLPARPARPRCADRQADRATGGCRPRGHPARLWQAHHRRRHAGGLRLAPVREPAAGEQLLPAPSGAALRAKTPPFGYLAPLGSGLCPGEHSSGSKRVLGSVTKHGNPRLRAALVELGWRPVRFQPQYPPVRKRLHILARGAKATGAARKKAIVAVARHLAVDLWRLHTGRCTAEELGLVVPGGQGGQDGQGEPTTPPAPAVPPAARPSSGSRFGGNTPAAGPVPSNQRSAISNQQLVTSHQSPVTESQIHSPPWNAARVRSLTWGNPPGTPSP